MSYLNKKNKKYIKIKSNKISGKLVLILLNNNFPIVHNFKPFINKSIVSFLYIDLINKVFLHCVSSSAQSNYLLYGTFCHKQSIYEVSLGEPLNDLSMHTGYGISEHRQYI